MKWLREPLVQFLLIGAALFGLFAIWGGPATAPAGQYHIVITPGMVQNLVVSYERGEKHPPTDKQIDTLINDYIREEILNREARALGLDQDDPIIRNELKGKMEFVLEDSAAVAPPTEEQLASFLQKNAVSFRQPDGTLPALKDKGIHDAVLGAWESNQRRQTAAAAYEKLRAKYTVEVQKSPAPAPALVTDKK